MKNRFDDYKQSVNYNNDICDNILGTNTDLDTRLSELTDKLALMDEKLLDVQWRIMRENLIFSGIPELVLKDWESIINAFIRKEMKIRKDIDFDKVHRLGRYKRNQNYHRSTIAKCTYFKDKELVRQTAPQTLIGSQYSVNE